MPEVRDDPLTGATVVVAPDRAVRPDTFHTEASRLPAAVADCPFCEGNEALTPPEILRRGAGSADEPGWSVRVVPNLFPIVAGAASPTRGGRAASGRHEVVVLSPAHDRSLADLADDDVAALFDVWRERVAAHLAHGLRHAIPFVNHGRPAGGSIEHPHAQLVVLDFTPPRVAEALARFAEARRDLVGEQIVAAHDLDLVVVDDTAPAWCPWASSRPYEIVVAHRAGGARFDEAGDAELEAVARTVAEAVRRLGRVLGDPPYNLVVHGAPAGAAGFHWHVRISPRVTVDAGFELGSGMTVNVVAPETAAQHLREARS